MTLLDGAACAGMDVDLWYPDAGDWGLTARLVCAGCPVREPCDIEADGTPGTGIRGGRTAGQRAAGVTAEKALHRAKRRSGWKPCAGCKELFPPRRATHRYCTRPCQVAAKARRRWRRDANHRAHRKAYMVALRQQQAAEKKKTRRRQCAARGCHEMFEPARNDQRYCSPRCRARQKMRRYREAHWNTETTDPETPTH